MRIAFFGGSFDPPHRGHLAIAEAARDRLTLDVVWMAPAGVQPLKVGSDSTSYVDRLAMVQLAVSSCSGLVASDVDAPRADGKPNYTIDVLAAIKSGLRAGDELFCLLGADAFLSIRQWHRAAELLFACEWIVAGRPGSSIDDLSGSLLPGITAARLADPPPAVAGWELRNSAGQQTRLYLMPDLHEEISATDIREAIAGEHSAAGVLAPSVRSYIEEKGLYR